MPLTLEDLLVQPSNSGSFNGTSGTATLPTPTIPGSTTLIVIGTGGSTGVSSVTGHANDFPTSAATARVYLYRRSNNPGGETSWTITLTATGLCRWTVYEVDGLDPDFPVDVVKATSVVDTSSGTTASTGTTPRSTTYDGLVVGAWASYISTSTTPTTLSGHTNGLTEVDEGSVASGSAAANLSVAMATTQQLGTKESTATASSTLATTNRVAAAAIVYTAAGAKRDANIAFFWGFKVGAGAAGLATGVASAGSGNHTRYWESQTGSPAITADGLQLASTSAAENITSAQLALLGANQPAAVVERTEFRFDGSLPSVDVELMSIDLGVDFLVLRYVAASQKLGLKLGTGSEVLSDATVAAGTFLGLDFRINGSTTAWTVDWQLDYGAGPVAQTQATFTGPGTISGPQTRLGWTNAITVPGVTFKYLLASAVPGHYPLGKHWVVLLPVDAAATPTISGTTSNFGVMTANGTIAAWNATNARNAVDDWPPVVGASADGAGPVAASATDYVEFPLETYAASGVGSIRAARVVLPMWAASATAATCRVIGWDGTTATTLFSEADPEADNSSTPAWICKMWRPTDGWTQAKLDAAAIRIGSNDATPDIMPHSVGMEVAIQPAETVPLFGHLDDDLRVEQALDPQTGGVIALVAYTPADQGDWELVYEVNGVEQAPVPLPASTSGQQVALDAPDMPTISRITLRPA